MLRAMDGDVGADLRASSQGGIFLRYQALDAGYTDERDRRPGASGKAGSGCDAAPTPHVETSAGWTPAQRHVLAVRAVAAQLDGPGRGHRVPTALAVARRPALGRSTQRSSMSTARSEKSPRTEAGVIHHVGRSARRRDRRGRRSAGLTAPWSAARSKPARILRVRRRGRDGRRRSCASAASTSRRPSDLIERYRDWSGIGRSASRALQLLRGRSATVGESRGRGC